MSREATTVAVPVRMRVYRGLRRPGNWLQLLRFGIVGASGYVVNLAVFAVCVHALDVDYRLAAVTAFLVAVANNFAWNRGWTFRARDGRAVFQAPRFLVVSLAAFCASFVVLQALVAVAGLPEVPAQAIAILAATPLNFIGNKLWSFSA